MDKWTFQWTKWTLGTWPNTNNYCIATTNHVPYTNNYSIATPTPAVSHSIATTNHTPNPNNYCATNKHNHQLLYYDYQQYPEH